MDTNTEVKAESKTTPPAAGTQNKAALWLYKSILVLKREDEYKAAWRRLYSLRDEMSDDKFNKEVVRLAKNHGLSILGRDETNSTPVLLGGKPILIETPPSPYGVDSVLSHNGIMTIRQAFGCSSKDNWALPSWGHSLEMLSDMALDLVTVSKNGTKEGEAPWLACKTDAGESVRVDVTPYVLALQQAKAMAEHGKTLARGGMHPVIRWRDPEF